jgi:hypothetical protein
MQRKISSFFESKAGPSASESSSPEKVENVIESVPSPSDSRPVNLRTQMLPNCRRMISKVMQLNFSCYPKCGIKLPSLNSHSGTLIFEWAFQFVRTRYWENYWQFCFEEKASPCIFILDTNRRSRVTDWLVEWKHQVCLVWDKDIYLLIFFLPASPTAKATSLLAFPLRLFVRSQHFRLYNLYNLKLQ